MHPVLLCDDDSSSVLDVETHDCCTLACASVRWSYDIQERLKHIKGKDKGHPITGHEDTVGEKRYSCTLSFALALDWLGGPDQGLVWTSAENVAPTGIRSPYHTARSAVAIPTELSWAQD